MKLLKWKFKDKAIVTMLQYFCQIRREVLALSFSLFQVTPYELIMIILNSILILGGVAGNILVCLSVATASSLKTMVNLFLVNLALADILVLLVCAPFSILQVIRTILKIYYYIGIT